MYYTATVEVKVKLVVQLEAGAQIAEVINEMDYQFDLPAGAMLKDAEILDYDVVQN